MPDEEKAIKTKLFIIVTTLAVLIASVVSNIIWIILLILAIFGPGSWGDFWRAVVISIVLSSLYSLLQRRAKPILAEMAERRAKRLS